MLRSSPYLSWLSSQFNTSSQPKERLSMRPNKTCLLPRHPDTSVIRRRSHTTFAVCPSLKFVCVHRHALGVVGGTPVNSKWMACSKRRSVFSHTRKIVHSGDVKKFCYTQARTGRHIVEACPQPSPNSFTRLSPSAVVYVSEQRHLFCSDRVFIL